HPQVSLVVLDECGREVRERTVALRHCRDAAVLHAADPGGGFDPDVSRLVLEDAQHCARGEAIGLRAPANPARIVDGETAGTEPGPHTLAAVQQDGVAAWSAFGFVRDARHFVAVVPDHALLRTQPVCAVAAGGDRHDLFPLD